MQSWIIYLIIILALIVLGLLLYYVLRRNALHSNATPVGNWKYGPYENPNILTPLTDYAALNDKLITESSWTTTGEVATFINPSEIVLKYPVIFTCDSTKAYLSTLTPQPTFTPALTPTVNLTVIDQGVSSATAMTANIVSGKISEAHFKFTDPSCGIISSKLVFDKDQKIQFFLKKNPALSYTYKLYASNVQIGTQEDITNKKEVKVPKDQTMIIQGKKENESIVGKVFKELSYKILKS